MPSGGQKGRGCAAAHSRRRARRTSSAHEPRKRTCRHGRGFFSGGSSRITSAPAPSLLVAMSRVPVECITNEWRHDQSVSSRSSRDGRDHDRLLRGFAARELVLATPPGARWRRVLRPSPPSRPGARRLCSVASSAPRPPTSRRVVPGPPSTRPGAPRRSGGCHRAQCSGTLAWHIKLHIIQHVVALYRLLTAAAGGRGRRRAAPRSRRPRRQRRPRRRPSRRNPPGTHTRSSTRSRMRE